MTMPIAHCDARAMPSVRRLVDPNNGMVKGIFGRSTLRLAEIEDIGMRLDTRTILIALVIFNIIAVGMSEVQRRALSENSLSSQAEFARQAAEWSKQQTDLLATTPAHLRELAARMNNIEIQQADLLAKTTARLEELNTRINKIESQTLAPKDTDKKTQEIYDRVLEMQKTLAGWKPPGSTDERPR
ncbi:hypothetical protein J6500_13865 [Bradyrhizobium sp. WSM 1704]|uniref:hypothetical protein n=1 Tax=Bradyrhizobium semiaridum TaxID=2821404 RepID=UPI001CE2ACA2|nr:hypothetical protein [Bradyrhizobium semiaridum]MCA6122975.1 hypothetical protein [Bradyrhizobium semiaridum]